MRRFTLSLILSSLLFAPLCASAGAMEPAQLPVLEPVFAPNEHGPPPNCMPFACYDGAVFDGRRLAAKAMDYPAVDIFARRNDGSWVLEATLFNPNPPNVVSMPVYLRDRAFGQTLVLNGRDLLVSSYWFDETEQQPPYAETHVFRLSDAQWQHVQSFPHAGSLGAAEDNTVLLTSGTTVRVVRRLRGHYYHESEFSLPEADRRPTSMSLRHGTVVFGVTSTSVPDTRGAVHVYRRFGRDWYLQQTLRPRDDDPYAHTFGSAVATDGNTVAVTAPGGLGYNSLEGGRADLYERYGWRWRKTAVLTDPYPVQAAEQGWRSFGGSIDVVGRRLAISASNGPDFDGLLLQTHLYERAKHRWKLIANTRTSSVQLRIVGGLLFADGRPIRYGTFPRIFQGPARDWHGKEDAVVEATAEEELD